MYNDFVYIFYIFFFYSDTFVTFSGFSSVGCGELLDATDGRTRQPEPKSRDQFVPESQRFVPESKRFIPEPKRFVPKPKQFVPESQRFVPKSKRFISEPKRFVQKPKQFVPEPLLKIKKISKVRQKYFKSLHCTVPVINPFLNPSRGAREILKYSYESIFILLRFPYSA